jgi:hypothetical protein
VCSLTVTAAQDAVRVSIFNSKYKGQVPTPPPASWRPLESPAACIKTRTDALSCKAGPP